MEFEEVLDETIALLQRQGRVSYGALKRRFKLDDAYLEDLKIELIEAQHLAHDENGRILVWAGEPVPPPPLAQSQPHSLPRPYNRLTLRKIKPYRVISPTSRDVYRKPNGASLP